MLQKCYAHLLNSSTSQPMETAEEVVCLGEGNGNNDGSEHFISLLWQGGANGRLDIDSTIRTQPVAMSSNYKL